MEKALKKELVGVFDSGVGGLSVLREIHALLPVQPLYYIGDQAHVPYGKRQSDEIRTFSFAISEFLINSGAGLIVVACNTASAAALSALRIKFPKISFVGMEPAVKPASQQTHNGVVGVLATPATFQGALYSTLVEKFAKDVKLLTHTLPGLVEEIEEGNLNSARTRAILREAIEPMIAQGADTLVLGCTHYPFVLPLIQEIAGKGVQVIDPAPAIARRTKTLLQQIKMKKNTQLTSKINFATTGDPLQFERSIRTLVGIQTQPLKLEWDGLECSLQSV